MNVFRRPFFTKLFNWEYWSFGMIYNWIYPVWIFLCIRARSFFFFAAANPVIRNGGFLNESKKDIYAMMPDDLYPRTAFFSTGDQPGYVWEQLSREEFSFPMIGKPDVGGRGRGIKILKSREDIFAYTEAAVVDFHIQEFVAFPLEAGIFYYRMPGQETGVLSGIVRKEFLTVVGDGRRTVRELLQTNSRQMIYLAKLEAMYGSALNRVIPDGQKELLVPIGNHARGAKFLDDSHLIDKQLTTVIDRICRELPEFYFGRLDIRYNSWEDLKEGKNFVVIEVNGAGSEPTHIYDPRHSLFFAWKEIIRHWIILWKISRINHRLGHRYLSVWEGIEMFREDTAHSTLLKKMPE